MLKWYRDESKRDDLPAVQQVSERLNMTVFRKECAASCKENIVSTAESCRVILT